MIGALGLLCGERAADIGLLGKKVRINGQIVEAVDVFVGGADGAGARLPLKLLEDVPCEVLPHVLEQLVPYLTRRTGPRVAAEGEPARPGIAAGAGLPKPLAAAGDQERHRPRIAAEAPGSSARS